MNYSKKIKELREKLFLTQEEFANKLNISPITVSRWESGKFEPTMKMRKKLYHLFVENKVIKEE